MEQKETVVIKETPTTNNLPYTKVAFNAVLNREVSIEEFNAMEIEALKSFSGIGDVTATAIVNHIRESGPFSHFEQLIDIKGIGEKKLAKILGKLP
jgi:competence protein ComEA